MEIALVIGTPVKFTDFERKHFHKLNKNLRFFEKFSGFYGNFSVRKQ